jgi:hypothetical protein
MAILAGLLLWNAYALFGGGSSTSTTISYSAFLDQARADNIAQVSFNGQAISGASESSDPPPRPTSAA